MCGDGYCYLYRILIYVRKNIYGKLVGKVYITNIDIKGRFFALFAVILGIRGLWDAFVYVPSIIKINKANASINNCNNDVCSFIQTIFICGKLNFSTFLLNLLLLLRVSQCLQLDFYLLLSHQDH